MRYGNWRTLVNDDDTSIFESKALCEYTYVLDDTICDCLDFN